MTATPVKIFILIILTMFLASPGVGLLAQTFTSNIVGFDNNRTDPIEMQMDQLEVNEKTKTAELSGNVTIKQNASVLRSQKVIILYEGKFDGEGIRRIRSMKAEGDILFSSGSQTASARAIEFDLVKNVLTMSGKVVLTQGQNIITGEHMVIDLKNGLAHLNSPGTTGKGRVKMLILPPTPKKTVATEDTEVKK